MGKLLGPKGNSLKRLQEETLTKMAILGRGSMRDKHKEEEYRHSHEPRYKHLSDDLHVEITAYAAPAEAHARIALALTEIRRFLVPVYKKKSPFHSIFSFYFLIDTSHEQRGKKGIYDCNTHERCIHAAAAASNRSIL